MPISYNEQERMFRLDTPRTTCLTGLAGRENFLGQIYYGPSVPDDNMAYLLRLEERPGAPEANPRERASFYDCFPFEYPAWGGGNFREPCLRVRTANGGGNCELFYHSHRIIPGKPALEGLPACYGDNASTLEIVLRDPALDLRVYLLYTVFEDVDAICRSVRVENAGMEALDLTAALSACLELDNQDFDLITLHGSWAREQNIDRRPLASGKQGSFSLRGISSHQFHPFLALCEHTADQERGLVYAMSLVYSGSFLAQAEADQFNKVRAVIGIHPDSFQWRLEPGESFQTPEAILVCSDAGLGGMSRTFHDLFRAHLIRGQKKHRPTLVNSWEACYFNFDHDRLLQLGREAAHRYVLGLYELQGRLVEDFPDLLLENCCSGGGRFDPGMLYYSPQIWTSDNAEAVDRLTIQEGNSLVYPLSAMGAHVASCRENGTYDAIMAVSKDKTTAVVSFVQVKSRAYRRSLRLRLAGLEEKALYRREDTGEVHTGAGWMRGGLLVEAVQSDYLSLLAALKRVDHRDG